MMSYQTCFEISSKNTLRQIIWKVQFITTLALFSVIHINVLQPDAFRF